MENQQWWTWKQDKDNYPRTLSHFKRRNLSKLILERMVIIFTEKEKQIHGKVTENAQHLQELLKDYKPLPRDKDTTTGNQFPMP